MEDPQIFFGAGGGVWPQQKNQKVFQNLVAIYALYLWGNLWFFNASLAKMGENDHI